MISPDHTWMNTNELAFYIRRSPAQIRQMVARHQVPFRKVCGRLLFLKSEIDSWIDSQPGLSAGELDQESAFPVGR